MGMTIEEEAIMYFKFHREIFCEDYLKKCPKDSIAYQATLKEQKFYDMAIKAIEQEPILDKIRAEIVDLGQRTMNDNRASGIWACRDIIDKYKAESEVE